MSVRGACGVTVSERWVSEGAKGEWVSEALFFRFRFFYSLQMIQLNSISRQQWHLNLQVSYYTLRNWLYPLHSKIGLFNSILNKIKMLWNFHGIRGRKTPRINKKIPYFSKKTRMSAWSSLTSRKVSLEFCAQTSSARWSSARTTPGSSPRGFTVRRLKWKGTKTWSQKMPYHSRRIQILISQHRTLPLRCYHCHRMSQVLSR